MATILERKYTALPEGVPLNEMQELIVPHMDRDYNIFVSAPTASGKSTAMYMCGNKHLEAGKSVVYIGIMRALAQEKATDLEEEGHPWGHYPRIVVSGDYRLTEARKEQLNAAKIITITPESLASKLRHAHAENNAWLNNIGILVIDEIHLLTQEGRGPAMEAALVEFTRLFPNVQLLGLSATAPNARDVADWMTKLNRKHTQVVISNYRPVPLRLHYVPYDGGYSREESEYNRIQEIKQLVSIKNDQQFLIGVWHKGFGESIASTLIKDVGLPVDFHNANKSKEEKARIEGAFKRGDNRVLVSTSTLFTGVNLPARNVIITAVEAAKRDISVFELQQAMGRAGRPRYDIEGDAYILVPQKRLAYHEDRIRRGERVQSKMIEPEVIATHFLGAMYVGYIEDAATFHKWYDRTLAQHQYKLSTDDKAQKLAEILSDMIKFKLVVQVQGTNHFRLTRRGVICAQMYLDPYHFHSILMNLMKYTALTRPTNYDLAKAMGMCSGFYDVSITATEKLVLQDDVSNDGTLTDGFRKAVSVMMYRLLGKDNGYRGQIPSQLGSVNFKVWEDMPRLHAAVVRALNESERDWNVTEQKLDVLFTRVMRKCSQEEAEFMVGKFSRAERRKLNAIGLYSLQDVKSNPQQASQVLSQDRLAELKLVNADGQLVEQAKAFGKGRGFQRRAK